MKVEVLTYMGYGPNGYARFGYIPETGRTYQIAAQGANVPASQAGDGFVYEDAALHLVYSDGSSAGTYEITDDQNGNTMTYIRSFATLGDQTLFLAESKSVADSDTTLQGALYVTDGGNTPELLFPSSVSDYLVVGSYAYVVSGGDLYRVDASGNSDLLASEDPVSHGNLNIQYMFEYDDQLYFDNLTNFYRVDPGTGAVERLDGVWGDPASLPYYVTPTDGYLYFFEYRDSGVGFELYRTDGTAAGTQLVKDINPGSNNSLITAAYSTHFAALGDKLTFLANAGGSEGTEVWVSDGTEAGTFALTGHASGGGVGDLGFYTFLPMTVDGKTFFTGSLDGVGVELFVTDGTVAGTHLVKDISPGTDGSYPTNFCTDGNLLYFSVDASDSVWVSDGTAAGTHPVSDPDPTASGALPRDLSIVSLDSGAIPNAAPAITSDGGNATATLNVPENTTAVTTVTADDGDGDDVTFAIAGGADAALFTINPDTGALAFLAAPSLETPGDAGGDNVYNVTVTASDGLGGSDAQAMAVTVISVDNGVYLTGDYNGDGIDDMAWRNRSSGYVATWLLNSSTHRTLVHPSNAASDWEALAPGDYNGDGIDDIAWRNTSTGYVSVWLMDSNGHRHFVHSGDASSAWQALAPGDFNGDGIDDIAWRNTSTGYVSVWLMDKNGHRHVVHSGDATSAWQALAPGDYNGDGITDIAWRNSSTGYVSLWLMDKNGHRHVVHPSDATSGWEALAPGDYNGDGITDIAWRNTATGYVSVWLMDKNGHRHSVHSGDASSDWQALGSGDYNGDGIDDMAWRNTATGYVSVWLMDKNGKRHFVHSGDATADWQALSPGDYNGDGITDIAWRNTSTGYVSVWQMDKNAHRHVVHPSDATNIWQAV